MSFQGEGSVQRDQNIVCRNRSTVLNRNRCDHTVCGSADIVFHLHCFENNENVALLDRCADRSIDLQNGSGERSLNSRLSGRTDRRGRCGCRCGCGCGCGCGSGCGSRHGGRSGSRSRCGRGYCRRSICRNLFNNNIVCNTVYGNSEFSHNRIPLSKIDTNQSICNAKIVG